MFDPSLLGRLSFTPAEPTKDPLRPGRNRLGIADERDSVLFVPIGLDAHGPVPLFVMFHGAGGFPEKVLPFIEEHAERDKFLILAPHSLYPTWDIVVGGAGYVCWNEGIERFPCGPTSSLKRSFQARSNMKAAKRCGTGTLNVSISTSRISRS